MLLQKMDDAQEEKEAHVMAFKELDSALHPKASDPWKLEIKYWEHNPNDSLVTNSFKLKKWKLVIYSKAMDALEELRQSLRLCDYMYTFKRNLFQKHQLPLISIVLLIEHFQPLLQIVGWNSKYKELNKKDDICGTSAPTKGVSEGRWQLSWIWLVEGVGDNQDEMIQNSLRVEWYKAQAQSM
ncbi:hypothetical protein EV424DRAFT_1341761 [Suillus variegatus]|nr:hypothetical protein EV424DRAFT_1341761 [Suillus variegatus]